MTLTAETLGYILGFCGLIGIIFGVYNSFKKPQEELDKKQAVDQKGIDGKAALLDLQVTNDRQATDRRFQDMGTRIDSAMTLAQNHIHTVDTKVDGVIKSLTDVNIQLAKLSTIIEERIPRK